MALSRFEHVYKVKNKGGDKRSVSNYNIDFVCRGSRGMSTHLR